MNLQEFEGLIAQVTEALEGRKLDASLTDYLNATFPPGGELFQKIVDACHVGVDDDWLCQHNSLGIDYGRPIEAGPATHGFSVDVVKMQDIMGPHHTHPNGEIDMIMPIDDGAKFDDVGKGWLVLEPGSAHHPTVTNGEALVLYLLPEGAIHFTKR